MIFFNEIFFINIRIIFDIENWLWKSEIGIFVSWFLSFGKRHKNDLTAVIFETGTMLTPTKSRNPTICGWGSSFQSYLTHS